MLNYRTSTVGQRLRPFCLTLGSDLLDKLPAEELLAFDRILERNQYDIDCAEIHENIDGSDDGFLYARGFIVAAASGSKCCSEGRRPPLARSAGAETRE